MNPLKQLTGWKCSLVPLLELLSIPPCFVQVEGIWHQTKPGVRNCTESVPEHQDENQAKLQCKYHPSSTLSTSPHLSESLCVFTLLKFTDNLTQFSSLVGNP